MNKEILEKYNCIEIGGSRYYVIDLSRRPSLADGSTPRYLDIDGMVFKTTIWKQLIPEVAKALYGSRYGCSINMDDLLSYRADWTDKSIFSGSDDGYSEKVDEGLYVNWNHTSTHAIYVIEDLIRIFDVDPSRCRFVIKRRNNTEPEEILNGAKRETLAEFKVFLREKEGTADNNIEIITKNVSSFDKPLRNMSGMMETKSFYTLDLRIDLANVKARFLKKLSEKPFCCKKERITYFKEMLDYYTSFFRSRFTIVKEEDIDFSGKSGIDSSAAEDAFDFEEKAEIFMKRIDEIKVPKIIGVSSILDEIGVENTEENIKMFEDTLDDFIEEGVIKAEKYKDDQYIINRHLL